MALCQKNTAAIILAGGQGQRMGGLDKGLQTYNKKTLIEHTISRIQPQTRELIISANRNLKNYESFSYPVIQDYDRTSYQGPMAGTSACLAYLLQNSDSEYALLTSCDTPKVPLFLGQRLMDRLFLSDALVAVAHDGDRRQNLHCLIKRAAWQSLIAHYHDGERAMHRWQRKAGDIEVSFADVTTQFSNCNDLYSLIS